MSDKEAAQEEATYRHGVFTYHLLDLLTRSPGGPLRLAAIYGAVGDAVRTATNGAQSPSLQSTRASLPLFRLAAHAVAPAIEQRAV